MESTAVVFFLEKSQYFLPGRTLFRQGATAPKSWQVPPVITGGVGEDTQIKSYYSRRKTKKYSHQIRDRTEESNICAESSRVLCSQILLFLPVFLFFVWQSCMIDIEE